MKRILSLLLGASSLWAADGVTGPVSGLLHMRDAGTVRILQGLPGAALLGPAVQLPEGLRVTGFRADADVAVGSLGDATVLVTGFNNGSVRTVAVPALSSQVYLVSAQGTFALLSSRSDRRLVIGSKIATDNPEFQTLLEDVTVVSAAVNASGRVVAAVADADGTLLLAGSSADTMQQVGRLGQNVAITASTSGDTLIADTSRDEVFTLSSSGELRLIAGAREGVAGPVAVRRHGSTVYIANSTDATLLVVDGGSVSGIALPCTPDGLDPVRTSGSSWRLKSSGTGPQYFFDPVTRTVFFVPAEVSSNE